MEQDIRASSIGNSQKMAMGRLLGQAFLSHQVNELESDIKAGYNSSPKGQGARNRPGSTKRTTSGSAYDRNIPNSNTRPPNSHGMLLDFRKDAPKPVSIADRIVVDASVLIYALDQVKSWSRDAKSKVIIPLEALNILDIFKKGTTPLATRARVASRFLEQQVGGVNSNVFLQQDRDKTDWDQITADISNREDYAPHWIRETLGSVVWECRHTEKVVYAVMDNVSLSAINSEGPERDLAARMEREINGELAQTWAMKLGIPIHKVGERLPLDSRAGTWRGNSRSPQHSGRSSQHTRKRDSGSSMVEKPPMSAFAPSGIRLLSRGESLAS